MAKKKASLKQLLQALAEERGIDVTDIEKIKGVGVKGRLEEGAGFREAFAETGKEKIAGLKETFSKKGAKRLGRKTYMSFFGGDDIFSAYMRGRLRKKSKKEGDDSEEEKSGEGSGDSGFTRVIAKESMMLPGMARDMNVMRQNIQKLVKLWSSKADIEAAKGKPYAQGADEFFMREDQREVELEASRIGSKGKSTSPTPEKEKDGSTLLAKLLEGVLIFLFAKKFIGFIKDIFSPKALLKVFTKVFVPLAIIGTLFSGITDGFKKYQETGSFSEAIISGLGGMLKFLTFGVFGEDTIRKLFDSISDFFSPITDTISSIFTGIKDFFVKMFGGQVKVEDKTPAKMEGVKPSKPSGLEPSKTETPSTQTTTQPPQTSTPTPVKTQTSEAKTVEKVDGEKIKLPAGVKYDPITGGYEYNGRMFTASDQKEIETIKKAIDDKKIVEYQTTDENLGRVTRIYNGATGESSFAPPKQTVSSPSPAPSSPKGASVSAGGSSGGGGGSVSAGGSSGGGGGSVSAGGSSGVDVGATPTAPSGSSVSEASSDVAEGQRMESAADAGSVMNAPTTNNNSGQTEQTSKKSSTVYDDDLAMVLAGT